MLGDQKTVQDIFRGMGQTAFIHLCVAIILTTMAAVFWNDWHQALFWIPAAMFYMTAILIKFFGEAMPYNISSTIVNLSIQHIMFFLAVVGIGLAVICRSNHLAGELVIGVAYLFLLFAAYKASRIAIY